MHNLFELVTLIYSIPQHLGNGGGKSSEGTRGCWKQGGGGGKGGWGVGRGR